MPGYKVLVDDNSHFMEDDERYQFGEFETVDDAIAACKRIVDEFLASECKPGISADELYDRYTSFGEDPFIASVDSEGKSVLFSAWDYAKERCAILAQGE